jgi:flagellar hook protein FlgE
MSFNIGLSGLYAANKQLDVTGNNIANVATTGFKSSRAEFEDVYSASRLGTGSQTTGNGVRLANVSQQFSQGDVSNTGQVLDLGIQGNGFFILSDNGSMSYTRAGAFKTDAENYVVDNNGNRLQGYGVDTNGKIINGVLTDLKINTSNQAPNATTRVDQTMNLNSSDALPTVTPFNIKDTNSYNKTISTPVYDTQGNKHSMDQYYVKTPGANSWTVYTYMDGRSPSDPTENPPEPMIVDITFNPNGNIDTLTTPPPPAAGWTLNGTTLTMKDWKPGVLVDADTNPPTWALNGSDPDAGGVAFDMGKTTSYASPTARTAQYQDGYATGQISSLTIGETGVMTANFSNGQTKAIGQVAVASFANEQGLQPMGGSTWKETFSSGVAGVDAPKTGTLGSVVSNSLEESNVNLTNELVDLIKAQSNYQANAKTISTESTIMQTIIQMA